MKQFDVYINPSLSTRDTFPYIIDIQNPIISDLATRIVISLGKISYFKNEQINGLTPVIEYENEKLLLLTAQIKISESGKNCASGTGKWPKACWIRGKG